MSRPLKLDRSGKLEIPEAELQKAGDDLMQGYGWRMIPQPVNLHCPGCGTNIPVPGAQKGQPDRLYIRQYLHARDSHPEMNVYVEYKKRGRKPTLDQRKLHSWLRSIGFTVLVWDRIEQVADWLGVKLQS